jgi:hypothetical protein
MAKIIAVLKIAMAIDPHQAFESQGFQARSSLTIPSTCLECTKKMSHPSGTPLAKILFLP